MSKKTKKPSRGTERKRGLWRHREDGWALAPLDARMRAGWEHVCDVRVVGSGWDEAIDPGDRKGLPAGAIIADTSKQVFGLGGGRPLYVDEERRCRSCGERFLFSAREQQYWYETLRFRLNSVPVECVGCRRHTRRLEVLRAAHAAASRAVEEGGGAKASLSLAESILALREETGRGNIDRGIGAARRAVRLAPTLAEAYYVEGRLQEAAGRPTRAAEAYERFLERRSGRQSRRAEARRRLDRWRDRQSEPPRPS